MDLAHPRMNPASFLASCDILLFADNLCKQFGPKSGPTECRSWPGSKPFDTLIVFLKGFFVKKLILKKSADGDKNMKNYPECPELICAVTG